MSRSHKFILPLAISLALGPQVRAQVAAIENSSMRIEILGLRRWSPAMMQDSLRQYSPKDSLFSHACAHVLQSKLHFADASVVLYPSGDGGRKKSLWLISVIEPQDSALVRYNPVVGDSLPDRAEWAMPIRLFRDDNEAVQFALGSRHFLLGSAAPSRADSLLAPALPLRAFLRAHRSATDMRDALQTISHDRNPSNRAIAALIMLNFPKHDASWLALVEALRDPEPVVNVTAQEVLQRLIDEHPKRVDWSPAVPTLRLLLNGTNLFAHTAVMATLAATSVRMELAAPLLREGGALPLAKLGSSSIHERTIARRLLTQLAGGDRGTPVAWEKWLAGL